MMKRSKFLIIYCLVMAVFVSCIYADSADGVNISASSDLKDKAYNMQFEGKFEEALPIINESIQKNPNNYRAWATKASILNNLNRYDEALIALDQALQLDPNEPILMKMKDSILKKAGRSNTSSNSTAGSVNEGNDTSSNDLNNKAYSLQKKGKFEEALSVINQSIQQDPNNFYALGTKASILNNLKRYDEALKAVDQALQLNPNDSSLLNLKDKISKNLKKVKSS